MNPKQTIPLIATIAPVAPAIAPFIPALLVGGAIFLVLNFIFSDDEKENKPETLETYAENQRKETQAAQKIPAKPPITSVRSTPKPFIPPVSAAPVPNIPVTQAPPQPVKKKLVTREDLATVFQRGAMTRTAAVAALKKIGFGKTAAYAALTPDGKFSAWLQFAPDGIITWTE